MSIIEITVEILKNILDTYMSMAPYLVFGFILAGVLHIFLKGDWIAKHLGHSSFGAVLRASLFGIPLPLCSCGVIPAAVGLKKEGASPAAVMGFLISTPMTGVDSILATYGVMGGFVAIFRAGAALVMGIFGGILVLLLPDKVGEGKVNLKEPVSCCSSKTSSDESSENSCCSSQTSSEESCGCHEEKEKKKNPFVGVVSYSLGTLLEDIAKPLIVGIVLSGILAWIIPDDLLVDLAMPKILQMAILLIAGIPLYICATSSLPLGAVLLMKGISPGVVFLFLAAGPATNAATLTTVSKTFGNKFLGLYLAAIVFGAMAMGFLMDFLVQQYAFDITLTLGHGHGDEKSWVAVISAVILGIALLRILWLKFRELTTHP